MTKNPILNALAAFMYIALISTIPYFGSLLKVGGNAFIGPITFVSLFTLSAAVMGYVFLYGPIQLYLENKKTKAINLFLQTVGVFGVMTLIMLTLLFSGIFKK